LQLVDGRQEVIAQGSHCGDVAEREPSTATIFDLRSSDKQDIKFGERRRDGGGLELGRNSEGREGRQKQTAEACSKPRSRKLMTKRTKRDICAGLKESKES
jgi:hypothetical protein